MKFVFAFSAILLSLALGGCQISQIASSSFSGDQFSKKPIKKSVKPAKPQGARLLSQRELLEEGETPPRPTKKTVKKPRKVFVVQSQRDLLENGPAPNAIPLAKKPKSKTATKEVVAVARSSRELLEDGISAPKAKIVTKKPKTVAKKGTTKTASKKQSASKRKVASVNKGQVRKTSAKSGSYSSIIARHAKANGVPFKLAMAVVQVESNFRPNARGRAGEIGLMQIMPRTARGIGYKGPMRNLYNPDTNIRYGMKYLGKAYRLGGGSTCGAILKYNAGHGAKRMNPISREYCRRVSRIMGRG